MVYSIAHPESDMYPQPQPSQLNFLKGEAIKKKKKALKPHFTELQTLHI